MATDDIEMLEDVQLLEAAEDNAKSLTSALVITTFAIGLLAFIMMQMALANWFKVGLFK